MRGNRNERSRGKRFGKKSARSAAGREDRGKFLKIVGVILVSTMILSVFCSIWIGWKIRSGLTDLDREKMSGHELKEKNLLLESRRAQLMTMDMIEKKAFALGLRKPDPKQVIQY